jgi:DNA-3-methyladenine glycosylase I
MAMGGLEDIAEGLRERSGFYPMKENKKRCFGSGPGKEFYALYHDEEWGIPVYDDNRLLEMLILEGAQAGLSWETVLKRREEYRKAFYYFDPVKIAKMTDGELEGILENRGVIRNRLKIYGARRNGLVFLQIQKEFGSFSKYIWDFVEGKPIITRRESMQEVPASTPISNTISQDLKKRGMTFAGPIIIYAFMQATGLVDDHLVDCPCSYR